MRFDLPTVSVSADEGWSEPLRGLLERAALEGDSQARAFLAGVRALPLERVERAVVALEDLFRGNAYVPTTGVALERIREHVEAEDGVGAERLLSFEGWLREVVRELWAPVETPEDDSLPGVNETLARLTSEALAPFAPTGDQARRIAGAILDVRSCPVREAWWRTLRFGRLAERGLDALVLAVEEAWGEPARRPALALLRALLLVSDDVYRVLQATHATPGESLRAGWAAAATHEWSDRRRALTRRVREGLRAYLPESPPELTELLAHAVRSAVVPITASDELAWERRAEALVASSGLDPIDDEATERAAQARALARAEAAARDGTWRHATAGVVVARFEAALRALAGAARARAEREEAARAEAARRDADVLRDGQLRTVADASARIEARLESVAARVERHPELPERPLSCLSHDLGQRILRALELARINRRHLAAGLDLTERQVARLPDLPASEKDGSKDTWVVASIRAWAVASGRAFDLARVPGLLELLPADLRVEAGALRELLRDAREAELHDRDRVKDALDQRLRFDRDPRTTGDA